MAAERDLGREGGGGAGLGLVAASLRTEFDFLPFWLRTERRGANVGSGSAVRPKLCSQPAVKLSVTVLHASCQQNADRIGILNFLLRIVAQQRGMDLRCEMLMKSAVVNLCSFRLPVD